MTRATFSHLKDYTIESTPRIFAVRSIDGGDLVIVEREIGHINIIARVSREDVARILSDVEDYIDDEIFYSLEYALRQL